MLLVVVMAADAGTTWPVPAWAGQETEAVIAQFGAGRTARESASSSALT